MITFAIVEVKNEPSYNFRSRDSFDEHTFLLSTESEKAPARTGATLSCKKCGARIAVSNPSKLHAEFSVKCTACETRRLYKLVDLAR
jgi:DNA-directed RNA polymerase subunit RPC12/RpoP